MVKSKAFGFIFAEDISSLDSGMQKALHILWNAAMLLLSSAGLCVLSLLLAVGTYDYSMFFYYFQRPVIFLLNWLPIFLLQILLLCVFGRQWLAFLGTGLLFMSGAIGNYYKLKFRYEPLTFADMKTVGAALDVAADYDLTPGSRICFAIAYVLIGVLLLVFLARCRPKAKLRLAGALAVLVMVFPLWRFLYSSDRLYNSRAVSSEDTLLLWNEQMFIARGFTYPFIYSIKTYLGALPEGYDKSVTAELLSAYSDSDIPSDRQVNILAFQLEAFCDLTALGIDGISPEAYSIYHALEEESYTGNLIVNVYGGGTHNSERCFLSGSYYLSDYRGSSYSHVKYLNEQGYYTYGGHPYLSSFYSRAGVNANLGFQDYWFLDTYYGQFLPDRKGWYPDSAFLPIVLDQYRQYAAEGPVFSFNVTTQGHGPYATDRFVYDEIYWPGEGYSDYARRIVNNYLGSVKDTQENLAQFLDALREDRQPAVVLLYGDHKPWMGDNRLVLSELHVNLNPSTPDGFLNAQSTRYLIWANDAAKELLDDDFTGEGPDVSVGFLMNLLFDKLGWEGSAFMQFGNRIRETLPVITSIGCYYENGELAKELSPEGQEFFRQMEAVCYYVNHNYTSSQGNGANKIG